MGRIRYTVTKITKRCPKCGEVLDTETHGTLTPIIACLWFVTLPIMISYHILNLLAFSGPILRTVGNKYTYCSNCLEIIKTPNYYVEELYGEYLLNHKFTPFFYLAYGLGSVLVFTFISFLFEVSTTGIIIASACCCALSAIIISYRVLLSKYKRQTSISFESIELIEKKQEFEYRELYKKLHKEDNIKSSKAKEQRVDNSFVANFEQKVSNHKKWRDDDNQGEQLIVKQELIKNVDMKGIKLQSSKFIECTFKKMDLSAASFRRCDLSNSTFIQCELTKTDFTGAILDGVKFKKCNINDAIFKN